MRDARTIEHDAVVECDVCIVGTGAAAVTCAHELLASGLRVLVLEAGGRTPEERPAPQDDIDSVGLPVPPSSRQRFLGGTTNSWWGKVALLDESDLERRPWMPASGWPIGMADLLPHYRRACDLLGLPDLTSFRFAPEDGGRGRERLRGDALDTKVFFWTRDPLNFGEFHRRRVATSADVSTLLHANAVELVAEADRIDRVLVATEGPHRFWVKAATVVLACGGIENARILLNSAAGSHAVGNEHDQVGRYYMDHPRGGCGSVDVTGHLSRLSPAYWSGKRFGRARYRLGVGLSPTARDRHGALNSYVNLSPVYGDDGGAVAAVRDVYRRRLAALGDASTMRSLGRGLPDVACYLAFKRFGVGTVRSLSVENYMEQEPRPANRVTLSARRDPFGYPLARVDWSLSDLDRESLRTLHVELDAELRRRGLGRLRSPVLDGDGEDWPVVNDAAHHMGATRMGTDPLVSVVDRDCRVHGTANLYLAGSSVFPTGGSANPTLTIVALAARLANHLRATRAREQAPREPATIGVRWRAKRGTGGS